MKNSAENQAARAASLSDQVRLKIISAGGLVGTQPSDLADDDNLATDYQFDGAKYALLCIKLQGLVTGSGSAAQISCAGVSACATVKDCVKLVTDTIAGA